MNGCHGIAGKNQGPAARLRLCWLSERGQPCGDRCTVFRESVFATQTPRTPLPGQQVECCRRAPSLEVWQGAPKRFWGTHRVGLVEDVCFFDRRCSSCMKIIQKRRAFSGQYFF